MIPAPLPYVDELVSSALIRCCRWFNLPFKLFARKVLQAPGLRANFLSVWPLRKMETLFNMSAEHLLWNHTPFPYATAFLDGKSFARARAAALDGGDGMPHLLAAMQNVSAGLRGRRTCIRCVADDLARTGETYWHRAHNLPGVFLCHRHGCPLTFTNLLASGDLKTVYALPIDCETVRAPQFARTPVLRALAHDSEQLLRRVPGPGATRNSDTYRAMATSRGFLTDMRPIRPDALVVAIEMYFPRDFMAAAGLPPHKMTWPALCFRPGTPHSFSPLKHLILQTTLTLHESEPGVLDHISSGPPGSSPEMLDTFYSQMARAELVRALADGDVLSTEQFLRRSGSLGPYRHKGAQLPMLRGVVLEFRASPASTKQLKPGSTLFRSGSRTTVPHQHEVRT